MNTAEYLIKKLEELGINDFFGLPGDYNFNILYAVEKNPNTKWIGCTNELNAGYAADGYARMRGYGSIITTYGVGELSAMNAIAGSYAENIPVINIVGTPATFDTDKKILRHHCVQDADYHKFYNAYKQITAAAAYLTRDNAKIEIDRVLKTFVKEKKPVYIAIPLDIAEMEISEREANYNWSSNEKLLEEIANKISKKINEAKRPVILGDALIKRFDATIEYQEFVSKTQIPTTNFLMGTNIIDMNLENYIGGYFYKYRNPTVQEAVENSDCLISVGPIYTDLNSFGYNIPYNINNHIAIYGTYTYFEGKKYENIKMKDLLEKITKDITPKEMQTKDFEIGYNKVESTKEPITNEYVYSRIQEFLKENDIVVSEVGMIPYGISMMKIPHNIDVQLQLLWASIGWATPATLGICSAKPSSRVILITGEGAHQLTCMEIGNIIQQGFKPVIIVINNNGYTTERILSNKPNNKINDIVQLNYSKFARVFDGDIWATRATTKEDFDKALKVTQIMNKLCYIEVCTESMDMPKLMEDMAQGFQRETNTTDSLQQENQVSECDFFEDISYETVVHKKFGE